MNGIVVVDKPPGFTSFDVVAKLRGMCQTKKIGHGGTLDPMATGVLPVFVGGATKAVDLAPNQDKAYEAVVRFGLATDTGDITGHVLRQSAGVVERQALLAVLPGLCGVRTQLPPMYSAVKINGKPLYKYAREGKEVQRTERRVAVHGIDLLDEVGENRFAIAVRCGKGTYIRALAEEMGAALGEPAVLEALRRTRAGVFGLDGAMTIDALQSAKDENRLQALLLPVETVFAPLPALRVEEDGFKRLINGAPMAAQGGEGLYRAYWQGRFLGLIRVEKGAARCEKLFYRGEGS